MKKALGLVGMVLLAGCGGGGDAPATSTKPSTIEVRGILTLSTTSLGGGSLEDLQSGAAACKGAGGFSDVAEGTQVTVTDEASKVLGIGSLDAGRLAASSNSACTFRFVVKSVPSGRPFYGIEVAHRGVVRYEGDKVASPQLQLGDS